MGQLLVTNWCRASIGGLVAFWLARAALHFTCSCLNVEENRSSTWILMCGFGSVGGPNTSKLYLARTYETAEKKDDWLLHIYILIFQTWYKQLLVWNCNQNIENQAIMAETKAYSYKAWWKCCYLGFLFWWWILYL